MENKREISGLIGDINQSFKERSTQEMAHDLGVNYIDLSKIPLNPDLFQIVNEKEVDLAKVIPFFRIGKKLRLAFLDNQNPEFKKLVKKLENQGYEIKLSLCSKESFEYAHQYFDSKLHHYSEDIVADDSQKSENINKEIDSIKDLPKRMEGMKYDEALNLLHIEILKLRASDMHLEPKKNSYRVRARIDGVLIDFFELPLEMTKEIIKQIKYMAHLKINIENMPQDGKYFFVATGRSVDVRVSSLPAKFGESVVMRFLDSAKGLLELESLGFSKRDLQVFKEVLGDNNGLILSTGPTGSGKTTTLHSALNTINTSDKKIITIEDPVEFKIDGIVQCEVHEDEGMTFAGGLRSILRQDPDVIMIGEIRDMETAETAIQSSLTGHLVFSTLHTNSASDAIPRLLNMGIKPFVLAPALNCIIAQRLVRKICPHCADSVDLQGREKEEISLVVKALQERGENIQMPEKIFHSKGCEKCSNTGFKGETLVAELLLIDEEMKLLIYKNPANTEILNMAKQKGMRDMWEQGICKVIQGITSFEELTRKVDKQ